MEEEKKEDSLNTGVRKMGAHQQKTTEQIFVLSKQVESLGEKMNDHIAQIKGDIHEVKEQVDSMSTKISFINDKTQFIQQIVESNTQQTTALVTNRLSQDATEREGNNRIRIGAIMGAVTLATAIAGAFIKHFYDALSWMKRHL